MTTPRKTPIRIFLDPEDHAKLSHLAGDAMETPNKLGAFYLATLIQAQHAKRQVLLANGRDPEPKRFDFKQIEATSAAAAAASPDTPATSGD